MRQVVCSGAMFLLALGLLTAEDKPVPTLAETASKHFTAWDQDKNQFLSLAELNRQVINPKVTGHEAAAIAALRRGLRAAKDADAKTTLAELSNKKAWNEYYDSAQKRLAKINRQVFPDGKPNLNSLNQGKLGNCFCLAPLGALCHRDADEVVKMIVAENDGMYRVKIGTEWVRVPAPTDAELALSASSDDGGIWVNVYEKAVGEWRMRRTPIAERPITALDLLTKGGSAGTMMSEVTGHKIERFTLTLFKNDKGTPAEREASLMQLREKLTTAFAEKRLVTTGTGRTLAIKPPSINSNHAYAVLGYDAKTDQLLVWNPHGQHHTPNGPDGLEHGYATKDGQFHIPLPEFAKIFSGLAFELRESK